MTQMVIRGSAAQLTDTEQRSDISRPVDNTLRFVQRCSRQRRLLLEHQLQDMQPGGSRLGRLLDLEA